MAKTIYIARDIERALGIEPNGDYLIVTNDGPYARMVQKQYGDSVLLIASDGIFDTHELLERPETAAFIERAGGASLLVFKSTKRIEEIFAGKGWKLLNPSAELAERVENKITQAEWLGPLADLLPSFKILPAKEIVWEKKHLVLQFAHAHTGGGTLLINTEKELREVQAKFPDRPTKASEFIKGPVFTVNVVVEGHDAQADTSLAGAPQATAEDPSGFEASNPRTRRENVSAGAAGPSIAIGNISYQITGLPPFTESPFATVGNDWSLTHTLLDERRIEALRDMARKIGAKMSSSGWKGLFGIDAIYDEERDEMRLIEINARQPASTTYESQLQAKFRGHGLVGSTIFEAHLAALRGLPLNQGMIEINDGAQIVQRITSKANVSKMTSWKENLQKAGYTVIPYRNEKPNDDLLRIQSARGIMEKPGKFNSRGEEIVRVLE